MATTAHLATVARRFPLVAWARPACPALTERVADLAARADELRDAPPDRKAAEDAAALLNLAALVASDCREPTLAENLCHRHLDTYLRRDRPLHHVDAPLVLGPATNLARLRLRASDGDTALRILVGLLRGVRRRTDVQLDGRTIPLSTLHGDPADHQQLATFAWLQLLTDGTKALALAGRWSAAVQLVTGYKGCGLHLFEGRQVTIMERLLEDDPSTARDLLDEATLDQPWEREVAAAFQLLVAHPDETADAVLRLADSFTTALGRSDRPHYRARLGVTTSLLIGPYDQALADDVLHRTTDATLDARDGYAAREVLQAPRCEEILGTGAFRDVRTQVEASGLAGRQLTGETRADLMDAAETAQTVLDSAYQRRAAWDQERRWNGC